MMPGLILPPYLSRDVQMVSRTAGSAIGNFNRQNLVFDGVIPPAGGGGTDAYGGNYVGKSLPAAISVDRLHIWGHESAGIIVDEKSGGTITIRIYGRNGSNPGDRYDGTKIGEVQFSTTADPPGRSGPQLVFVDPEQTMSLWDRVWASFSFNGETSSATRFCVSEMQIYQSIRNN